MKKQIVTILQLISMLSCCFLSVHCTMIPDRDDGPELYERKPLKPGEIDPAFKWMYEDPDGKPIKREPVKPTLIMPPPPPPPRPPGHP